MPFNQALFWFGLTAFGTGLYYLFEASVKRLYSTGMTVIGAIACMYTVYRDSHPESPVVHLWVILLVLTWALLIYNIYLHRRLPPAAATTPSPSWIRFLSAYPEIAAPPPTGKEAAKKPQKARCEFLNCTSVSYKVKMIGWDCGSRGLDADFWRGCFQLRLGNSWYPEWNGVEELHVPPGESFRFWIFPKSTFTDEQFRARVNSGNLGTVHLLIDGKEIAVSVE
jgi:hypothetical protein